MNYPDQLRRQADQMPDRSLIRPADAPQMDLSRNERSRLEGRIEDDYSNALSDHDSRMRRFRDYYVRWRGRTEDKSLYRVPITQWQTYAKLAKEHASLFGADAQVVARPVGPNDQRHSKKIGLFQSWRLFHSMNIERAAMVFNFRKVLFGRSHAYMPWERETYSVPLIDGGEHQVVCYDGPRFLPLWPDDLVVPAEDVQSIQEFSFVLRKVRMTPDQLLRGEDSGRFQGIRDNFEQILMFAEDSRRRDFDDVIKAEKDLAEGVTYEGSLSAGRSLIVHEWYGRWRPLKGRADGRETNINRRAEYESEVLIKYMPDLRLVCGAQDLAQMYPAIKERRPFVESGLVQDGSYWCPSFGELLERIENELSENHNMGSKAGKLSVGPVVFYRPASGFDPETFEYEPGVAVPTDDPNGVRVVEFRGNLEYPVVKEQTMLAYAERVTGQNDMNMGRTTDRPNQPRTARQTMALLEEGDVRASLDLSALREDWGDILKRIWALEQMYGSPSQFFRVTEQDADGAFPTDSGGAYLDESERNGGYDFELKFATNAWSRETEKERQLSLYQIDLQNPLVINNPRALWLLLDKIHKAFGDDRFGDVIPEPPDLGLPVHPREEWTRLLQGEIITVNPLDNDELHLLDHNRRLQQAAQDPNVNQDAYADMVQHSLEHTQQLQQKKFMAEMADRLVSSMAANTATGRGLAQSSGPIGLDQVHQQIGGMINPAPGATA